MAFNFDWLPMREAAELDCQARARRSLAKHTRWRIVKWWHNRKASKLEESADIWRGLEWRTKQWIEHEMKCPGDTNE
jgi:hypothetical protein